MIYNGSIAYIIAGWCSFRWRSGLLDPGVASGEKAAMHDLILSAQQAHPQQNANQTEVYMPLTFAEKIEQLIKKTGHIPPHEVMHLLQRAEHAPEIDIDREMQDLYKKYDKQQ